MDALFGLIPAFGGIVWILLAFVVALSIIVAIHEYGHYIVGRWSGIHADVFSIGFGPVVWSRQDKRGTRWQIAALPLGGYVKFAGDANAASGKDEEAMEEAAADPVALRRTMHGAPLWARAATVAAGPIFNFILSILIFGAVMMTNGTAKDPLTVGALRPMPQMIEGLQSGDVILQIAGIEVPTDGQGGYDELIAALPDQPVLDYTVERDGQRLVTPGPFLSPPLAGTVLPQTAAMEAGLQDGDVITAVNGREIYNFFQLQEAVEGSGGEALDLSVWRSGEVLDLTLTPKRTDEPAPEGGFRTHWRIGVSGAWAFEPETQPVGLWTVLKGGTAQVWRVMEGSVTGLGYMITGQISTCNLSGPIGIAQTSGAMASMGLEDFIWFVAVISTAVGLLNLFPIPALDGGHLVFYAYEAVAGKPPSDRALQVLMAVGLSLVLCLMVFALTMDIFCP